MRILKVEEFEFFQYFENEMEGLREHSKETKDNQESAPVVESKNAPVEDAVEEPEVLPAAPTEDESYSGEPVAIPESTLPMPDEMVASLLKEAELQANELMTKAALDASEIVNLAKQRAAEIEEEARQNGYDAGFSEGKSTALKKVEQEQRNILEERYTGLLESLYGASLDLELKKEDCMKRYLSDLSQLAITIAEKVINISLKSSGEVIERMILSTMETSGSHQWAKIRISAQDEKLMKQSGIDLEGAIQHVADRVKIVVIEDAPAGTCYVEFPDQIIDASVETQLQNIKEVAEELQF